MHLPVEDKPSRAAALRSVSDSTSCAQPSSGHRLSCCEYFGYLRRNPTDAPDNNDNGYQFWLTKLECLQR